MVNWVSKTEKKDLTSTYYLQLKREAVNLSGSIVNFIINIWKYLYSHIWSLTQIYWGLKIEEKNLEEIKKYDIVIRFELVVDQWVIN